MNKILGKGITIIVAAVLIALCVGSAYGVYEIGVSPKVVSITAAAPTPVYDACHVLGSFTANAAAVANQMAYSAGVYSFDDVSVPACGTFKVYNATDDAWINTIDTSNTNVPYSFVGAYDDISLTKAGQYDIHYTEADGIAITADSFDYTFHISHSGATNGSAVIKAWIWGDGIAGHWVDVTIVSDTQFTATFEAGISACNLARFDPAVTVAWDNQWNATPDINLSSGSTFTTYFW